MLTDERYEQLMGDMGVPNSRSLLAALKQAVMEAEINERLRCIRIINNHKIPVGNSAAGEMACEWTYDALREIRTQIVRDI